MKGDLLIAIWKSVRFCAFHALHRFTNNEKKMVYSVYTQDVLPCDKCVLIRRPSSPSKSVSHKQIISKPLVINTVSWTYIRNIGCCFVTKFTLPRYLVLQYDTGNHYSFNIMSLIEVKGSEFLIEMKGQGYSKGIDRYLQSI